MSYTRHTVHNAIIHVQYVSLHERQSTYIYLYITCTSLIARVLLLNSSKYKATQSE